MKYFIKSGDWWFKATKAREFIKGNQVWLEYQLEDGARRLARPKEWKKQ
jgi:hypothetical protein